MKQLINTLLLFLPILAFSQEKSEYYIFEIETLRPASMTSVGSIEKGLADHNKKYHPEGIHGARVYQVLSGPNSGDYKWVMGPTHWSSLDTRPADDMHDDDWMGQVGTHLLPTGNTLYIRFDPALSRFPMDFNVSKLLVRYVDIPKGKYSDVKALLEKVHKVFVDKVPNETYGIYFNELPSSNDNNDMTIVSFFDKYAWMSEDIGFEKSFEEVHGDGSWKKFMTEWEGATGDQSMEIWEYREDLSGMPAVVKVAERQ